MEEKATHDVMGGALKKCSRVQETPISAWMTRVGGVHGRRSYAE